MKRIIKGIMNGIMKGKKAIAMNWLIGVIAVLILGLLFIFLLKTRLSGILAP